MSMYPTPRSQKRCLAYCGDEHCTCDRRPDALSVPLAPPIASAHVPDPTREGADLREAIAAHLWAEYAKKIGSGVRWPDLISIESGLRGRGSTVAARNFVGEFRRKADRFIAGPLATLTAALDTMRAELDRGKQAVQYALNDRRDCLAREATARADADALRQELGLRDRHIERLTVALAAAEAMRDAS